jgi:cytochrome c oxidase cbb3-type subunit 3
MAEDTIERVDAYSGVGTTGHEWDGIKELDNPLPRWWLWIFYASIAWSVVYMIFMPASRPRRAWTAIPAACAITPNAPMSPPRWPSWKPAAAPMFARLQASGGQAAWRHRSDPDLLNFALAAG